MLTILRFLGFMYIGWRRMAPKGDLYYNKAMDTYYHPECLSRDLAS